MNLFTKQKQTHRHRKQTYGYKRKQWGGINWEYGINRYTPLYIKQVSNKDLLYSTGNYIQSPVINHNGKKYEKDYIYVGLSHFAVQQKLIQHCQSNILQ